MSESPFLTMQKIIAEPSNSYDELRIIAKDEPRLSVTDREKIRTAADELEWALHNLISTNARLIEAQQQLIAANEQLIEMRKKQAPVFPSLSLTINAPLLGMPK